MGWQNRSRWLTSMWVKRTFSFSSEEQMLEFEREQARKGPYKTQPVIPTKPYLKLKPEEMSSKPEIGDLIAAIHSENPAAIRKAAKSAVLRHQSKKSLSHGDAEVIGNLVAQIVEECRLWKVIPNSRMKNSRPAQTEGSDVAWRRPQPFQSLASAVCNRKRHPLADPLPAPYKAPPLQAKQVAVNGPLRSKTRCG